MINYNKIFINSPIEQRFKKKFKICHILYLLNALLEILSISIIIPVVSFTLELDNFFTNLPIHFFSSLNYKVQIIFIFGFIFSFFLFRAISQMLILSYQRKFIAQLQKNLSENVFKRCIFRNLQNLSQAPLSDQVRNLTDTGKLVKYVQNLLLLNTNFIMSIFIISFLLVFNFEITLFFFFIFSFLSILYFFITNSFFKKTGIELRKRTSAVLNDIYNALNSLKEIIIDRKRDYFFNLFSFNNSRQIYIDYKTAIYGYAPRVIGEFFLALAIICAFIYFFTKNYSNSEIILNLSLFVVAGLRLLPSFVALLNSNQALKQSIYSTEKVLEIVKKPFNFSKENIFVEKIKYEKQIKVNKLKFGYKSNELILNNVNFAIKKGTITGLSGESGSGKSTLVNLITGLLEPLGGSIYVDNKNIFTNLDKWHNSIGYVPQDVFLIRGPIQNNIAFGVSNKEIDQKKVRRLIDVCQLKEIFLKNKINLNYKISEKSSNISGGQKQRIGIARALYKNPKLLILDETTSSLNQELEEKIFKNLKKEFKDMSIILISHRINTLRKFADVLYEVKNKKVIKLK